MPDTAFINENGLLHSADNFSVIDHNITQVKKVIQDNNLSLSTFMPNTSELLDADLPPAHDLPLPTAGMAGNLQLPWSLSMAVPEHLLVVLILMYAPIILMSVCGSILVIQSVIRSPNLRTSSNSYLVNLALSDLLLAALTCPITLCQLVSKHWQLPLSDTLCSLSYFLPLFFSFLSTFTITVIALDRHHLIVHTSQPRYRTVVSCIALAAIWIAAFLCAAPILPNTRLDVHTLPEPHSKLLGISHRAYCKEHWNYQNGRLMYSIFTLSVQLLLPCAILTMAHARIYRKLRSLPFWNNRNASSQGSGTANKTSGRFRRGSTAAISTMAAVIVRRQQPEAAAQPPAVTPRAGRGSRTLYLLICVVVVFVISWLPLNTLNLLLDVGYKDDIFGTSEVGFRVAFAMCHLLGMSSAISNPIIYGYFNQGFREEFMKVLLPCRKSNNNNQQISVIHNKQNQATTKL